MKDSEKLVVATFNVNSIRQRMEVLLEWIAFNDPDILCLQETKVQDNDFPRDDLEEAGYHVIFKGMKSYNGVAIMCKEEPNDVAYGLDDGGEPDEARLIRARFKSISVVNTYVPQGQSTDSDKYAYKLEWFRRLKAYFERHFSPGEPLLWTGDLNVAPEAIDVYDPKRLAGHVCFNPDVTAALHDVMNWGLVDVFRKHRPDPGEFTFWDYRMPRSFENNLGWRIDHLLATKPLANRSIEAFVDRGPRDGEKPSDHTILVGVFEKPK
jgi:exodeoxyribonuclease III